MSLVMMMTMYTLVFQSLLQFHLILKPKIHIRHPLLHVLTVLLPSQKQKLLHYQLLSLIQLNLINFLQTRLNHILLRTFLFICKNSFQGFFLPDDFSLDLHTLQLQQTQDPVLKQYIIGYVTILNLNVLHL